MRQRQEDFVVLKKFIEVNDECLYSQVRSCNSTYGNGLLMGFQEDALHLKDESVALIDGIQHTIKGISKLYYIPLKLLLASPRPNSMTDEDFHWLESQSRRFAPPAQIILLCECDPQCWAMVKYDTFV